MSIEDKMKQDHANAHNDHAEWLREISLWRSDHRNALAMLRRLEATIFEIDAEMEAHAAAIRSHHMHINHHTKELAAHAHDQSSDDLHRLYEQAHAESMATHADVKERHESLTVEQRQLMENIATLFEALSDDT